MVGFNCLKFISNLSVDTKLWDTELFFIETGIQVPSHLFCFPYFESDSIGRVVECLAQVWKEKICALFMAARAGEGNAFTAELHCQLLNSKIIKFFV